MRLRLMPLVALLAAISLLFLPAAPVAACRAAITFDEAVAGAEYIVVGLATRGQPYWFDEPGDAKSVPLGRAIVTPSLVVVEESLKGPAGLGDTLLIGQFGGQIGDEGMFCTAEQYIGSGTYLLFLSSGQGPWAQIGLRVNEAWSFAGDTLAQNPYWPVHTKLSKLRADIEDALRRGAGSGTEEVGIASDGAASGGASRSPVGPGIVVVAAGFLTGSAVGAIRVRRARS